MLGKIFRTKPMKDNRAWEDWTAYFVIAMWLMMAYVICVCPTFFSHDRVRLICFAELQLSF